MMQVIRGTLSIGILVGIAQLRPPFFPPGMTSCESDLIMDTVWSLQMKTALQKIKPGDGEELSLDAITLASGSRSAAVLCLVTQSCQTLCNPMDCSPPSSSVHRILQARILEWVARPSSRGSSRHRVEPRHCTLQADSLPSEPPE